MKSALLASFALAVGTLGLTACGGGDSTEAKVDDGSQAGISVTGASLVLPAVKGNPAAVYFTAQNDGDRDVFIRAASVEGAESTQLHQMTMANGVNEMGEATSIPVPKGTETAFAPGGNHVMAFKLDDSLAAGGTTNVTLTFVGGRTATFPAEVKAAGSER
ncbi:copper chaperone PCu(A)C [Altererythrobacter salegens]|uniref:Copper chaperone PCu(A)C n=1 Tax=Croceibacterium salegens TaxID=1737568 RepID=A0A6I4STW8_9SPHN|nr:copper chaperone PCu(A)C [Croceibacterium salegens]MXO58828.1 copper chaperone PCu(A)C [Croceibacterium salegens]